MNIGNFINSSANDYIYVYGGKVGGNDDATSTKKVNVSNNTVTVDANNSTISYVYGGVIGGKANGNVKENKVEIKSGTVYGVFGGLTTVGDATGNSVSVIDGDLVTGRSMNYTIEFASNIVRVLLGEEALERIEHGTKGI